MRISDWSSDVCSSDLEDGRAIALLFQLPCRRFGSHTDYRSFRRGQDRRPEFSDGPARENGRAADLHRQGPWLGDLCPVCGRDLSDVEEWGAYRFRAPAGTRLWSAQSCLSGALDPPRSEEQTSEIQSLIRSSYAV